MEENRVWQGGTPGKILVLYPKIEKSGRKSGVSLDKSTKKYYSLLGNLDKSTLGRETFTYGFASRVC